MTAPHEKEKHKGFRSPECVLLDMIKNLKEWHHYQHTHTHTLSIPFYSKAAFNLLDFVIVVILI